MENPIKMDDLGVRPFKETPMYASREKSYRLVVIVYDSCMCALHAPWHD